MHVFHFDDQVVYFIDRLEPFIESQIFSNKFYLKDNMLIEVHVKYLVIRLSGSRVIHDQIMDTLCTPPWALMG